MPRKGHVVKPEVLPDPIYNSKLVTSLINHLMIDGKRVLLQILYAAFDRIKEQTGNDPVEVFQQAMDNVEPVLKLRHAVSVVPTTKFQSKFVQNVE